MICRFKQCGFNVYDCFTKLFETCVLPVALYGAGIWGHKEHSVLNTIQNRACRFFLSVPAQSPNIGTRGEMGWTSLLTKSKLEVTRMWCRLCNMDGDRLTKHIFLWSSQLADNRRKNWVYSVRAMFDQAGINDIGRAQAVSTRSVLSRVRESLNVCDQQEWYNALWNDNNNRVNGNKLRTYRLFKSTAQVEPYLLLNVHRLARRSLSMLRIGVLPLHVETGRYSRPVLPLADRKCMFCHHDCVEDEKHFLLACPLYSDQRQYLLDQAHELHDTFNTMSDDNKFTFLMNEPSLQLSLCKTVNSMFDRRYIFTREAPACRRNN